MKNLEDEIMKERMIRTVMERMQASQIEVKIC